MFRVAEAIAPKAGKVESLTAAIEETLTGQITSETAETYCCCINTISPNSAFAFMEIMFLHTYSAD